MSSRTSAYNADVLLYKERQLQIGLNIVKKCRPRTCVAEQYWSASEVHRRHFMTILKNFYCPVMEYMYRNSLILS